jgi:hypothetical protein
LFSGELVLNHDISDPGTSVLTSMHFSNYHTQWTGWFDESKKIELRVAVPINPFQQMEIFREKDDKQIYVINKDEDLFLWFHYWGGEARRCIDS